MKTAPGNLRRNALVLGASLALAIPATAEASPTANTKARETVKSLGARVIRLYDDVRTGRRKGVIQPASIESDIASMSTITFSVDSNKSKVAKSNGKRTFQFGINNADHRELTSLDRSMDPNDVTYIDMTVGGPKNKHAKKSPFELGVAYTSIGKIINQPAWIFDGEYVDANATHHVVVNGSTNPKKFAGPLLTVSKIQAAAAQMNGIISDAVHDRPVDVLPAPFHGEVYKVQ